MAVWWFWKWRNELVFKNTTEKERDIISTIYFREKEIVNLKENLVKTDTAHRNYEEKMIGWVSQ